MKLNAFKDVMYSSRDSIQSTILYDSKTFKDIVNGCSIEYAIENYGDHEVKRIMAENGYIIIGIIA